MSRKSVIKYENGKLKIIIKFPFCTPLPSSIKKKKMSIKYTITVTAIIMAWKKRGKNWKCLIILNEKIRS